MNANVHEDIGSLRLEVLRLQQVVHELQGERQKDRQALEDMKKEWVVCLRYLASLPKWPPSREELEQWGHEVMEQYETHPEDFLTLDGFIDDLGKPGNPNGK